MSVAGGKRRVVRSVAFGEARGNGAQGDPATADWSPRLKQTRAFPPALFCGIDMRSGNGRHGAVGWLEGVKLNA